METNTVSLEKENEEGVEHSLSFIAPYAMNQRVQPLYITTCRT